MRRWYIWVPVVMVASLFYWTVALGLGGLSLMAASALSINPELGAELADPTGGARFDQSYDPITVHLEESIEPQDVNDDPGCGYSADPGDGSSGPGQTSF